MINAVASYEQYARYFILCQKTAITKVATVRTFESYIQQSDTRRPSI